MDHHATLPTTLEGRRVLVTGHTGFKGSWLSLWLLHLGAEVIGYSLAPPSSPNLFENLGIEEKVIHFHGDILDEASLYGVFSRHQPEVVFHLAAQPLVRLSYANPVLTYQTNVTGTAIVLEAVRRTPSVRAAVIVTSDKCYENREWIWGYRETDPMGGHDPYSSSKGCAELVASAYQRSFFPLEEYGRGRRTLVASARAGNVIGGGDWGADRLIPDCARYLNRGEQIVIRSPGAVRPWQHVLEPLSGYISLAAGMLAGRTSLSGPWNFGPADCEFWTVESVVREVIRLWGDGSYRVESDGKQLHEAHTLRLDCSKAFHRLGWTPKYNVRKALESTIDWYAKFYSGVHGNALLDFTLDQIKAYEAL